MPKKAALSPSRTGLLIAVELGSEWPVLAEAQASTQRVLAQIEGEAPLAFADRVASQLDALFAKGVRLGTVALSCNERVDADADAARRKLLGLALGSMAKGRSGKVYLTAPSRSSGRLRHSLSSLAQALSDEWRTAGLEASVSFAEQAAPVALSAGALVALTARVA